MKQILFFPFLLLFALTTFAQGSKFEDAMKQNIGQIDSITMKNNAIDLANRFARIGDAEKTRWLPYYYAAYLTAMQAVMTPNASEKDPLADQAEAYLTTAKQLLAKESAEIAVIESLIATARLTVDPQNRYQTYGMQITKAIEKAKSLDPANPRPVLLEAQNLYYTPEAFGGGKAAARPLFEKARDLFKNFQPEDELSPNWGLAAVNYFLSTY